MAFGEVTAEIGGQQRVLRLGMVELEKIEADTGQAVLQLAATMTNRGAPIRHMRTIIQHGLLGGGWTSKAAAAGVAAMTEELGYSRCVMLSKDLLAAAIEAGSTPGD